MKVFITALLFSLIFLSVHAQPNAPDSSHPEPYLSFCVPHTDSLPCSINLDWVQHDQSLLQNIINPMPATVTTLSQLTSLLPHFSTGRENFRRDVFDQGDGLQSAQYTVYGGYGGFSIYVLCAGEQVLTMRITADYNPLFLETYLVALMKLSFHCHEQEIVYDKTYSARLNAYQQDHGRLFLSSTDTNIRRNKALNYFADLFTGPFQKPFYIANGLGGETFDHLRYFIVNRDYPALEDILYTPSPTSHLLAARTLQYLQEKYGYTPSPAIHRRMQTILATAQPISSGILNCWLNKFTYDYYDVVNNFEQYLNTE